MINKIKQFFKDKKGFTLVELMVVVAILGILTMVAIPVFNKSTDKAKITTCEANVRTIESALAMAQANGDSMDQYKNNENIGATLQTNGYLKEAPKCPFNEATPYKTDANGNAIKHTH